MTTQEIIEKLAEGTPFEGIDDIKVTGTETSIPEGGDSERLGDVMITLQFGDVDISIFPEIKTIVTPKILQQIVPWLVKLKKSADDYIYPLVCPYLSPESQEYCLRKRVDFIDLSGNISLVIPGKLFLQRLGRPNRFPGQKLFQNPFSKVSSRIIRVLLEFPKKGWTIKELREAIDKESKSQGSALDFGVSQSTISKTILSLAEELLVRRDDKVIVVPDPRRLLFRWAEKYREQYRRENRNGWTRGNPFSLDLGPSVFKMKEMCPELPFVLTGSSAANLIAPFVSIDRIDVLLPSKQGTEKLSDLDEVEIIGPEFFFLVPADAGAFMFRREVDGIPVASDIQIYLDSYSRGGRDAKQAEYLLGKVIEERWQQTS